MKLVEKRFYLVLLFIFMFLAYFIKQGQSEELNEDLSKIEGLFLLAVYPRVVTIKDGSGGDSIVMLVNLGNKPISLGRVNPETGKIEDGDHELRVSIDISNAPLRYIQIGEKVAVSDIPHTNENLISGITLMPKAGLWLSLIASPRENLEKSEAGVAKLVFTLSGLVNDEIKTLIEIDISILYKTGKQIDDSRIIQASIKSIK